MSQQGTESWIYAVPIGSGRIGDGVLAPNAKLRSEIIPDARKNNPDIVKAQGDDPLPSVPVRVSRARLLTKPSGAGFERRMPARRAKAREGFRKRVFEFDLEYCSHCGGELKIIAAIEETTVIAKILAHLGLPTRAQPRAPARNFDLFEPAWFQIATRFCRFRPEPTISFGRDSPATINCFETIGASRVLNAK